MRGILTRSLCRPHTRALSHRRSPPTGGPQCGRGVPGLRPAGKRLRPGPLPEVQGRVLLCLSWQQKRALLLAEKLREEILAHADFRNVRRAMRELKKITGRTKGLRCGAQER